MEFHSAASETTKGFRDPTRLTNWTRGFLYASIASSVVRTWLDAGDLLGGGGAGAWAEIGSDSIVLGVAEMTIWLMTAILVLNWVHRANHNARQLGAADLHFTPGWAVGWHFVPIAWFWKPYRAMTEIWCASRNPADWRGEPVSSLLPWWWVLWIVPTWSFLIVDLAAPRYLDEARVESVHATTGLATWILQIPLALVLLVIIGAVHRMQTGHHRRQVAEV